jgi:branched-subunit amino acid transport protein AzlD
MSNPWLSIAVMSGVTVALRAVPLLLHKSLLRRAWMVRLNQELPPCVMVILVAHSLGAAAGTAVFWPEIAALCVVAVSYLRWRNALSSVVLGLAALALLTGILG